MDLILKNPGLQHIAEDIFLNLDENSLTNCATLNQNAKEIIDRPMFWFKKLSQKKSFSNYIEPWKALIRKLHSKLISQKSENFWETVQISLHMRILSHYFSIFSPL